MHLRFNVADLKPLVEHALAAKEWSKQWTEDDSAKAEPALILVKDEGAYLMSNGLPILPRTPGDLSKGSLVIYALGYSPEDGHIGGDDWAEYFPLKGFERLLKCDVVAFTVRADSIEVTGEATRKPTPRQPRRRPR